MTVYRYSSFLSWRLLISESTFLFFSTFWTIDDTRGTLILNSLAISACFSFCMIYLWAIEMISSFFNLALFLTLLRSYGGVSYLMSLCDTGSLSNLSILFQWLSFLAKFCMKTSLPSISIGSKLSNSDAWNLTWDLSRLNWMAYSLSYTELSI